MNVNDKLVTNLNRIINEKGLKQKYVAEMAHMNEKRVSAILTGRQKNITATDIGCFCVALDTTPNVLFGC